MFSRIGKQKNPVTKEAIVRFTSPAGDTMERHLKANLAECLRDNPNVLAAYLARVTRSQSELGALALCVRTEVGPDQNVVRIARDVCRLVCGDGRCVEVIFLSASLELEISGTCKPFFGSRV